MERRIDFFIVGAQKSGTTALYRYLSQHPDIFMPQTKENHYFVNDEFYCQGEAYLEALYRDAKGERCLGGADVDAMHYPYATTRLHAYNPQMKIIAVLRNPIDRAYSAYWFARRNGTEDCETFEEGLAKEDDRKRHGTERERVELAYLTRGEYARQIKPYMELFGCDSVRVILSEDLFGQPEDTVLALMKWLDVRWSVENIDIHERVNPSAMPRSKALHRFLHHPEYPIKRYFRRVTSPRFRYYVRRYLKTPLIRANTKPFSYPPINPETRKRLAEHFAPFNEDLAQLLGRDLRHWN